MLLAQVWQGLVDTPQLGLLIGFMLACLIPIAGIVGHYWFMAQKSRAENGSHSREND